MTKRNTETTGASLIDPDMPAYYEPSQWIHKLKKPGPSCPLS